MSELRIILFGVGRIGRDLTRLLATRPGDRIVAAHSRNPALTGKDLGELAGIEPNGVLITADRSQAISVPADVLVIATTSFLKDVAPDIRTGVEQGLNVATTAEEMAFPWAIDPTLAGELDQLARRHAVTILGTGLNPGFLSDAIVITAAGLAWEVERIRIRRVVNLSHFSATILARLGVGYKPDAFQRGTDGGTIFGHIGFPQSMQVVADALGVEIDKITKRFEPMIANRVVNAEHLEVQPGQTAGFRQHAIAHAGGRPWYEAEFVGHLAPESAGETPQDDIYIDGSNPVHLSFTPGLPARLGAVAMVANSLGRVVEAPPGLLTVADVPPARPASSKQRVVSINKDGGQHAGH